MVATIIRMVIIYIAVLFYYSHNTDILKLHKL
jgi:hypothetical protein